jgi:hypothetical protein
MGGGQWDHGYEALASLDADGDGFVGGGEARGLYLWFDRNQNAAADEGEVEPLSQRVSKMACRVVPDHLGDVSVLAGAQLVSGEWVQTWDWWMNVWIYPILGRPTENGYQPFFPFITETYPHSSPVHIYRWKVTADHGSGAVGASGLFRIVPLEGDPSQFMIFLQSGPPVADVVPTSVVMGSRVDGGLNWTAGPETTEAFVTSPRTIHGRTISPGGEYEWEAELVEATTSPLGGVPDQDLTAGIPDLFDPTKVAEEGEGSLYFRGPSAAPVQNAPPF